MGGPPSGKDWAPRTGDGRTSSRKPKPSEVSTQIVRGKIVPASWLKLVFGRKS